MNFPNFANKYAHRSLLTARDIVDYRTHLGRQPKLPDLQGVLLCLERGLPQRLHRRIPVQLAGKMNGDLYAVKKTRNKVAVMTNFGGGSPIVVELAEEFIAMGAKRLILMTWGGTLDKELKAGDIVVCNQAIRDEGTSYHYLPPAKTVQADHDLVDRLLSSIRERGGPCSSGTTWTTDAPYRETLEEIQQYQSEGVKVVEMESAGLFALGQVMSCPTASIVVVMDSLASYHWQVPDRLDAIQKSLEIVYASAIDVLAG